jgi:hypothetical protein
LFRTQKQALLNELQQEAETTRHLPERVPEDRLACKPHPKSMTLRQLTLHVATIPGDLCCLAQLEEFDASNANLSLLLRIRNWRSRQQ